MDCPACHSAMITMDLAGIEIDHCLDCGGIWLDRGELEAFINDQQRVQELMGSLSLLQCTLGRPRRCPICDVKMEKVQLGTQQVLLVLDRCPRQDGLWFDRGELTQVLQRAGLEDECEVIKLLASMFAFGKGGK